MSEMRLSTVAIIAAVTVIVAVCLSTLIAFVVVKQGKQGIQGIQGVQGVPGTQGAQGDQGIQGIQGPAGEVDAYVDVSIGDQYTSVSLGTDTHHVTGYAINFGSQTANDVEISLTWDMGNGTRVYKTISFPFMRRMSIQRIDQTFSFGGQGNLTYTISWFNSITTIP